MRKVKLNGKNEIEVKVRHVALSYDFGLPTYATEDSSGIDLIACMGVAVTLMPGKCHAFQTGLAMEIPKGYEGQIRSKSGLAPRNNVFVLNSPDTIDSDYRGEIEVILANFGSNPATIFPQQKIAQMVFAPVTRAKLIEVDELSEIDRGKPKERYGDEF